MSGTHTIFAAIAGAIRHCLCCRQISEGCTHLGAVQQHLFVATLLASVSQCAARAACAHTAACAADTLRSGAWRQGPLGRLFRQPVCFSSSPFSLTSLTFEVPPSCRWINEQRITIYVEHPVPIAPPVEEAPAAPMPLVLTARERKKMRTQRRMEREKERQVGFVGGV